MLKAMFISLRMLVILIFLALLGLLAFLGIQDENLGIFVYKLFAVVVIFLGFQTAIIIYRLPETSEGEIPQWFREFTISLCSMVASVGVFSLLGYFMI